MQALPWAYARALPHSGVRHLDGTRTRRATWWYARASLGLDVIGGVIAAYVAFAVRNDWQLSRWEWTYMLGAPLAWMLALAAASAYDRRYLGSGSEEYQAVGRAMVWLAAGMALVTVALQAEVSRVFAVVFAFVAALTALGSRFVLRSYVAKQRAAGRLLASAVVVGRFDSAAELIRQIRRNESQGMKVVAACVSGMERTWDAGDGTLLGVPVFGPPELALEAVEAYEAEIVAVASHPDLVGHSLRRLGWALAERQVELVVAPGISEVALPRLSVRPLAGISMLHVESPSMSTVDHLLKRSMDVVLALVAIIAFAPVMAVVALLVKMEDGGPILYLQERVGRYGEHFKMFKFRSMRVDADSMVQDMPKDGQVNKIMFKQKNDPRVTPVGKFIRRFSLDELPQFFNVLIGDMSLVGPRPPLPREVAQYESDATQRLRCLPGVTGLWQVSGRSDLDWDETLRLDLWYVDNWSPTLDLQILVRTFRAVLRGSGAY